MTKTILITVGFIALILLVSQIKRWRKAYQHRKVIRQGGGIPKLFQTYILPSLPMYCNLEDFTKDGYYCCIWENKYKSRLKVVFVNDVLTMIWKNETNEEGYPTETSFTFVHPLLANPSALLDQVANARRDHYQKHQRTLHDQVYRK